jgi:hypothetical protein
MSFQKILLEDVNFLLSQEGFSVSEWNHIRADRELNESLSYRDSSSYRDSTVLFYVDQFSLKLAGLLGLFEGNTFLQINNSSYFNEFECFLFKSALQDQHCQPNEDSSWFLKLEDSNQESLFQIAFICKILIEGFQHGQLLRLTKKGYVLVSIEDGVISIWTNLIELSKLKHEFESSDETYNLLQWQYETN